MKKWFIILGIMLLFCSCTYAGELYSSEKGLSNCVQSLNKVLADKRELSGNVEVYLDMKLNHSLNAHKIISYDNKELAELVDDSLKSLEKSPEDFERPRFRGIVNFIVQDGKVKTDVVSRNYITGENPNSENAQYYSRLLKQLDKEIERAPHEDYIDLHNMQLELSISSLGKVKSIRLIQSSGERSYDDKLCSYFLDKTFDMPPSGLLKDGYYRIIMTFNPTSRIVLDECNNYKKQITEEIQNQVQNYTNLLMDLNFDKEGRVTDVKLYSNYDAVNAPKIVSELKQVKVTPYKGKLKGDTLNLQIVNNSTNKNIINYYNNELTPVFIQTAPEINSLKLKPVKCLVLMNKHGKVEEAVLLQSSGSERIDKDTISAVKYNSYKGYKTSPTEKFIFNVEIYNLNKYLRESYLKYSKTVSSYTIGCLARLGMKYMKTEKVYMTVKKDGRIKKFVLLDYNGRVVEEKSVEEKLKRQTFPKFPPNIDAEELDILVDLYDPENSIMSNIIMNSTSIGAQILYIFLQGMTLRGL